VKINTKKAIFYGWWLVAAAALIYVVEASVVTTFGVYIKPMAMEFHWGRSPTTLAFSFFMLTTTAFSILAGYISDRYIKPKWVIMAGGLLMGLGLILTSHVHALWQFYLCYSVLGGAGFACVYIPIVSSIPRWFKSKQGLALGIFYAGGGIGGLIFSPLIQSWIDHYGWRTAWFIMAIIVLCIIIPFALFIKRDPSEKGLLPLGEVAPITPNPTERNPSAKAKASPQGVGRNYTVAEALKTKSLWIFSIATSLILAGILMAQINLVPNATDLGISAATASLALGFANGFNAAGRLGGGFISDRIGTRLSMIFCLLLGAAALFWFIFVNQPWMLFLFAVPFGFAYGFSLPQTPRIIAELFGTKSMGAIMGVNGIFGVWGPAFGPFIGAWIYDHTDSYKIAFLAGGVAVLIGLGLILTLKLKRPVHAAAQTG
jgi:MFS family permease